MRDQSTRLPPHEHHRRVVRERGGEHSKSVLLVEADVACAFVGDEVQAGQLRVLALRREGFDQGGTDALAARRARDIDVQMRRIVRAERREGLVVTEIGEQRSFGRVVEAAGEIADDGFFLRVILSENRFLSRSQIQDRLFRDDARITTRAPHAQRLPTPRPAAGYAPRSRRRRRRSGAGHRPG